MSWLVGGPPGLAYQREREVLKRHDSTPPGSWLREQYEKHRAATAGHSTEDAFDPGPRRRCDCAFACKGKSYCSHKTFDGHGSSWDAPLAFPVATRDQLLRRLDAMLGREGVLDGLTPPVSDYAPQMAREMYDDGA